MNTLTSHQRAQRNYYTQNKEKLNANSKKWYEENKEKVRDIRKKCYEKYKGTFECKVCDKKYSSKGSLNKHYTSKKHRKNLPDYESEDEQYVPVTKDNFGCDVCKKTYSSKSSLKRHFTSNIHKAKAGVE